MIGHRDGWTQFQLTEKTDKGKSRLRGRAKASFQGQTQRSRRTTHSRGLGSWAWIIWNRTSGVAVKAARVRARPAAEEYASRPIARVEPNAVPPAAYCPHRRPAQGRIAADSAAAEAAIPRLNAAPPRQPAGHGQAAEGDPPAARPPRASRPALNPPKVSRPAESLDGYQAGGHVADGDDPWPDTDPRSHRLI